MIKRRTSSERGTDRCTAEKSSITLPSLLDQFSGERRSPCGAYIHYSSNHYVYKALRNTSRVGNTNRITRRYCIGNSMEQRGEAGGDYFVHMLSLRPAGRNRDGLFGCTKSQFCAMVSQNNQWRFVAPELQCVFQRRQICICRYELYAKMKDRAKFTGTSCSQRSETERI